jgi:hypothetical protein
MTEDFMGRRKRNMRHSNYNDPMELEFHGPRSRTGLCYNLDIVLWLTLYDRPISANASPASLLALASCI